MLLKNIFDLQLFADGGDSGSAGEGSSVASGVSGNSGEDLSVEIPRSIPERAKKRYLDAVKATRSVAPTTEDSTHSQESSTEIPTATSKEEKTEKLSYSDLIKSEEYKEEHEAYMRKTISDRLKKYSGIEEENASAKELLYNLAQQHGIDTESKTFFNDLKEAMGKNDVKDKVQKYLETHDASEEEATRIVQMEEQLAEQKRQEYFRNLAEQELQRKQAHEEAIAKLKASAEKTKALYPDFSLETAMQNEAFKRICAACNGDTTAAYRAVFHEKIATDTARAAAQMATVQATNAVAANNRRPAENGLASTAPSVADIDFSKMNAKQLREFWQKNRDMLRR